MSLDAFIRLADTIVEFDSDISDNIIPLTSVHSISVHIEELKSTWSKIKLTFEKYISDYGTEQNGDEDEDEEDMASELETIRAKYKTTYITYCKCVTRLSQISDELQAAAVPKESPAVAVPSLPQSSSPSSNSGHSFNLPPCDTEVFSGDYMAWPTFRDMFTAVYIKNCRLSPVEKLFHLVQKTKGEAKEIVQKSPLTNNGFNLAWKNLCDRYENKRILVNGQLKVLFSLPSCSIESAQALKRLQRDINSCISALQIYDIDIESWDPIFVFLCSNRLPDSTLTLWEQTISDKASIPKWSELDDFLTNRYRTLESVSEFRSGPQISRQKEIQAEGHSKRSTRISSFQNKVSAPKCPLCPNELHIIRKCPKFSKLNVDMRLSEIKRMGLCLNCFSKTHSVKNCPSKHCCYTCNRRHNTLLHRENNSSGPSGSAYRASASSALNPNSAPFSHSDSIQSTSSGAGVVQSCFASNSRGVLLGTAVVNIRHLGVIYSARALFDSGSEGTFISERLFNMLKLPFKRTSAHISGLNNSVSANVQKECTFILGSRVDNDFELTVNALVIPKLSGNLPSHSIPASSFTNLPDIQLADPHFFKSAQIDLLFGGDILPSIMMSSSRQDVCGSLMAQETVFGWILTGPVGLCSFKTANIISNFCEISLDKEISRFWEVENLPRKNFMSPSDKICEDLFISTTKRADDGRYIVRLPFKEGTPDGLGLGHSRASAMAQFLRNEARLLRNPEFKREYDRVVVEYDQLGHMRKVSTPKFSEGSKYYFLPHHAVIKPDSSTTKVRVVFNASSPSSNGLSLNDILHTGPVLQNDLTMLILRWRFFRFVFNADIQKMYRQIMVHSDHTRFQMILHRDQPGKAIQDFELQTVTFGVNCAPYLAIRVLIQLADDVATAFPIASNILRNFMYVDDVLAGAHSIPAAIDSIQELNSALNSAGFSLRKWTANFKEILADIPSEHLLCDGFLDFEESSTAKMLGIRWDARADSFFFVAKPFPDKCQYTKRAILSQIAKLFDPAGWLSPCIVLAKILMQKVWASGVNWDDSVTPDVISLWEEFQGNYSSINRVRIPRWIDFTPACTVQFHGFCDASEKAYAAALYVRITNGDSISTHLVYSRTKVAPLKTLSIPRLELCGAVLLADMLDSLLPKLDVPVYSLYCWTDSTIVLSWLAKPPCTWKTFVANRVSNIIQVVDPSKWRHVTSECNPADLASRGIMPQELINNELWWLGPKWLHDSPEPWTEPTMCAVSDTDVEKKALQVNFSYFTQFEDVLERFSSFSRALRVLAFVYRFYYRTHPKFRSNFVRPSILLSSSEISMVRDRLISMTQKAFYPNEYKALSTKRPILASSSIRNLNPFIDAEGLIRSSGRLESSPCLTYNEKHPILLPYNCRYSKLLVSFVHSVTLHGGNQLVLRVIRTQYWIPKVKNLVKTTINQCKPCILYKKRCQTQLMAALPPERSEFSRPFSRTGLDFAGPFDIKSYSGRACRITKGYVCVFVCFSTKAIHLEATSDLSTSTFLAAFHRFVSRRGCPSDIYSDNGTTFVGASRLLAKDFLRSSRESVSAHYAYQGITWHFIPPGAPHMGGLWEAGVKSFKTHFRKFSGSMKFTFEEFATLLSRIEACLNSRPLSPMSQDPSDFSALTPGHFLIGSPILAPVDPQINEASTSILNRWEKLKAIHQHFCIRWKNEYLRELQKRHKWQTSEPNIRENALVAVRDENLPPNSWRLGRISKTYSGSDGRVRVADVITQRGVITRPITKLVVLLHES